MIRTTLARYAIRQQIGAGGMGEVYLAEDLTLNRHVALKVLPGELASREQRARFALEAKTLAALEHPNIVTVYSIEEDLGVHFITMELVKGKTLAAQLGAGGLPLDRFFEIAIPLTDAVAAAHSRGIVHRDLKPGNVMVSDEGRVKVLDFGLAKSERSIASLTTLTAKDAVVGTWRYMSPEQARGADVDARSDIFSVGVMFHEMLTGRQPFAGEAAVDALSSMLKDAPPEVTSLRAAVPRELSRLVRRCLVKDPARRAQSALDIRNQLEELRREIESGQLVSAAPPARVRSPRARRALWGLATLAGAAAAGAIAWLLFTPRTVDVLRLQSARQVTFAAAVETQPTWSPDGGRIAYVSDQSGNQDIWVAHAAGGPTANLTQDSPADERDPSWSPDGGQIAFVSDRGEGGLFVMPAIGGPATRIVPRGTAESLHAPQWSRDGSELAYLRRQGADAVIEIVSLPSRQTRQVTVPGGAGNRFDLRWSPDGRSFAYVRAAGLYEGVSRVWILRLADEQAIAATDGTANDWSPSWSSDSRALYYVSNRAGTMDLWQQPLTADGSPAGDARPVTVGVGMQQAAFSVDGRRVAYSRGRPVTNIWRIPIVEHREATWADAVQLTFDQAHIGSFDLFPDGRRIVVSSDRGGNVDLWTFPVGSTEMTQLTTDRSPEGSPRVSPDGQRVAYQSYRNGERDLRVVPADGGQSVPIAQHPASDWFPAWTPDGTGLSFYSSRNGIVNAFLVSVKGDEVRQISDSPTPVYHPQVSPDGQWMAYTKVDERDGVVRLWRQPAAGGAAQQLSKANVGPFRWSPDGTRIFFRAPTGSGDVWELRLADGHERRVTRFTGRAGAGQWGLAVGTDDLYLTWGGDLGDIWAMEVAADR